MDKSTKPFLTKGSKDFKKILAAGQHQTVYQKAHCRIEDCQFKAFKSQQKAACNATNKTVTVHLDWLENAKLTQAREEKSAYYHEDSISLHPIYISTNKEKFSVTSISDNKSHKAAAVFASLEPVLYKISFQQGLLW